MDVKEVVLLGRPGAGKTSLAHALSGLSKALNPTVAPELYALQRDTQVVHLWDTPGQGQYSAVSAPLLERASLVLLCSPDGDYPKTGKPALRIRTKNDLNIPWFQADLATSAKTGDGVQQLFHAIFAILEEEGPPAVESSCCCGCHGVSAIATHSRVDQYRLDLLLHTV